MKDSLKFTITSGAMFDNAMHQIGLMLKENGWVTVEAKVGNRTVSQNSLYWEWLTVIANKVNELRETDYTKDDIHDWMRDQFLGYTAEKKVGKLTIKPQLLTTTELTKGEMFHYMSQIDHWAASWQLMLPKPEDSMYMKIRKEHESGQSQV